MKYLIYLDAELVHNSIHVLKVRCIVYPSLKRPAQRGRHAVRPVCLGRERAEISIMLYVLLFGKLAMAMRQPA